MAEKSVDVLLATFNGGPFLSEQLDSILAQTYNPIRILISDDGSSDNTIQIIEEYLTRYPERIKLIDTGIGLGSSGKFVSLLQHSTSDYIFFSDQDDVWVKDKIEKCLKLLRAVEKDHIYCAVYSDMTVVDKDLNLINPSFLQFNKLNPEWSRNPYAVLSQSMAPGCTIGFNSNLKEKLSTYVDKLFQHDQWILIHAAWYGKIVYLPECTVKYRQHGGNEIGAHGISKSYFLNRLKKFNQIWARWHWISNHLQPRPSILKIAFMKMHLNLKRI